MSAETWYLDTSAFVKLLQRESETTALRAWLAARPEPVVSSDLLRTEAMRVARRLGPETVARCRELLTRLGLIRVDVAVFDAAGALDLDVLRALDALHIAAALTLGEDLAGIVTYDRRMQAAAAVLGLPVAAPAEYPQP